MAHDAMEHVQDAKSFHICDSLFGGLDIPLPAIPIGPYKLQITKYMVLELIAAGLILAIFIPLSRRAKGGDSPRGSWWNAFEALLTFIRDEVAKPNLGEHHADRYTPFLWTLFLFILFCNVLGMFPLMGSPTASISVTGALAICAFIAMHGAAIREEGLIHYFTSLWPHIELGDNFLAKGFAWFLSLGIYLIELFGTVIKAGVLAVRLFANMFAGHMVLASILMFIVIVGEGGYTNLWPVVTFSSVFGVVALSLLELFVAFLQAYIFVFLTALFMGMALHPEH
jgi:F-type H+-transporting ATPase subunit a